MREICNTSEKISENIKKTNKSIWIKNMTISIKNKQVLHKYWKRNDQFKKKIHDLFEH